jgi:hypothetical protein
MGQELTLLPLQIQIGNQLLILFNSQLDFILQANSLGIKFENDEEV